LGALLHELHSTLDPVSEEQLEEIRSLWPHRDPRRVAVRLRGGRDEGFEVDGDVGPLPSGASQDELIEELIARARIARPAVRPTPDERARRMEESLDLVNEAVYGPPAT
jgi:hypothetical protein